MPLTRRKPSRPTHGIAFSVGFAITRVPSIEQNILQSIFATPSTSCSSPTPTPTPTPIQSVTIPTQNSPSSSSSSSSPHATCHPGECPTSTPTVNQTQPSSETLTRTQTLPSSVNLTNTDICKALSTLSLSDTDFGNAFFALCDLRNEGKVLFDHILLVYAVLRRLVVTDVKRVDRFRQVAEDAVWLVFLVAGGSTNTKLVKYEKWSRLASLLGDALGGVDSLPTVEAVTRLRNAWRSAQPPPLLRRRDGALDFLRLLDALRIFDAGLIVHLRALGVILTHAVQTLAANKEPQSALSLEKPNVPDLDQFATLLSQFVTVKLQTIIDTSPTSIPVEQDGDASDTAVTDSTSNASSSLIWSAVRKRIIEGDLHENEFKTDVSDVTIALRQELSSHGTYSSNSQGSIVLNSYLDSSVHSIRDDAGVNRHVNDASLTIAKQKPVVKRTHDKYGSRSPFCIDFSSLQLGEKIGAGAYGEVYRATYLMSPVAVKVFHVNLKMPQFSEAALVDQDIDDPRAMQRMGTMQVLQRYASTNSHVKYREFVHEVELMSVVRHPNLVLYMGACANPFSPLCIVSELFTGGSLYDYLHKDEKFRPSSHAATSVSLSIARGMYYLHSSQPSILHRDLKSHNVLLSGRRGADGVPHVVICDFGLCQLFGEDGAHSLSQMGTAAYMSPDSINGVSYCAKDDVYSYGVLMHEIYSGIVPYRSMRSMQIIFQVSNCGLRPTSPFDEDMPLKARQLMQECWDGQRDKRPSFENIIARLDALVHELGTPSSDSKWAYDI